MAVLGQLAIWPFWAIRAFLTCIERCESLNQPTRVERYIDYLSCRKKNPKNDIKKIFIDMTRLLSFLGRLCFRTLFYAFDI